MPATRPLSERFWEKVDRRGPDECWPWTASIQGAGYGTIARGRPDTRIVLAHRVSYELNIGPIPDGLTVDHLCRNRACQNPVHLQTVTHRENVLRGEGIAARQARQTVCKRGHDLMDETNVIRYPHNPNRRYCRACKRAQ